MSKGAKKKKSKRGGAPGRPSRARQYAAIPIRLSPTAGIEVLLLTSRGTGRWVIPKGWPMRKKTPADTAAREAFEEAGVKGRFWSRQAFGTYRYRKEDEDPHRDILVRVFILVVDQQKEAWPEQPQRSTGWFPIGRAARLVREPGLSRLLLRVPTAVLTQAGAKAAR